MITDIHSHIIKENNDTQIISFCMEDYESQSFKLAKYISVGIHPWFVTENNIMQQIEWGRNTATSNNKVKAIGECGIDKLCNTPIELQYQAFTSMIELSEELKLPLIIHSVRTNNDIISLKKQFRPKQKWIIHGFRGKKETAMQLLSHDIYISIGEKFNPETIKCIPKEKLLTETDNSKLTISQITENIAISLEMEPEELRMVVTENTNNLFFKG